MWSQPEDRNPPRAAFRLRNKGFMSDPPDKKDGKFTRAGICIGVAIGCGIGLAIGNLALGIGPGVAVGMLVDAFIRKSRR